MIALSPDSMTADRRRLRAQDRLMWLRTSSEIAH